MGPGDKTDQKNEDEEEEVHAVESSLRFVGTLKSLSHQEIWLKKKIVRNMF